MSHISSFVTEIRFQEVAKGRNLNEDPGWKVFLEALKVVIEEEGGKLGDVVYDYFGRPRRCDVSIFTPSLRRGIGVEVSRTTGEVRFLCDDYGIPRSLIERTCNRILQSFAAIAVSRALQDLNYDLTVEERTDETDLEKVVLIRAEM